MFAATKRKFHDVTFRAVDIDKDPATANKYQVPGIPHIVFLDASDKVIYRSSGYSNTASFTQAIKKFQ